MGHWRKQMISFFVTSVCNLGCTYCYMPKFGQSIRKDDRVLDLDFAIAGMKDFFAWSPVKAIRYFSSGEPTCGFELMQKIQNEAYQLVPREQVETELQTNGYFSPKVADWVEEHVNICWISADGAPELQDKNRPTLGLHPSSNQVLNNIKRFAANPKMEFGVRVTFVPEDFDKQIEVLKYYRDLGLKYVCGAPSYSSPPNDHTGVPMLVDFSKHFVPAFYAAQEMGLFYQTHLMVNFDEKVTAYCRACTSPPCPQLTTDGFVSCCDWASFGPDYYPGAMQQCVYGKWDKENKEIVYFQDVMDRIANRTVETLGQGDCKDCPVLEHCAGGCIGKIIVRSGDLYKMDPNWCSAVRYLAQHIPQNTGLYPVRHS